MTKPTDRNRLAEEESPYLQAHADNPVNWQPWDRDALSAASERDVPIFLSIGYSSCHWCHVMAEESFEDPAIAERLNEHFVPIKVDREERPEIDNIYMTVCRLVRQGGCGWPLSVWLTPAGKPFYVGTYFPKEPRGAQPGFGQLLDELANSWDQEREEIEERGNQWMDAAKQYLEETPPPTDRGPTSDVLLEAAQGLVKQADREHGGFGSGQKFPQPSRLLLLAMAADRTDLDDSRAVLEETLDAMADGGLRDHLGGGFHRYCTDRTWTVPHFEKMLYDNATIPQAFLWGYRLTGNDRYRDVATETFDFLRSEMEHSAGGFYSALDARSIPPEKTRQDIHGHGVEGAYYVWTPNQVRDAISEGQKPGSGHEAVDETDLQSIEDEGERSRLMADIVTERFGITGSGNFEGRTVLTLADSIDEIAIRHSIEESDVEAMLEVGKDILYSARSKRPRPPRDEKILAGWNGLAIESLAEGALVTGDNRYAKMAEKAFNFVESTLWDGTHLHRRFKAVEDDSRETSNASSGSVKGDGLLEDYAYLANGALSLHGVTGTLKPLSVALDLGRAIEREFWDPDRNTLYYTPKSGEAIPVRPQQVADESTPSSTGVALDVLLKLDAFAPEAAFRDIVDSVLRTHSGTIEDAPTQHPTLARVAAVHGTGHLEVTTSAAELPSAWLEMIGQQFRPDLLLTHRPPDETALESWVEQLHLDEAPPIWAGRESKGGPTAFVCRQACSPPLQNQEEIKSWIDEFGLSDIADRSDGRFDANIGR